MRVPPLTGSGTGNSSKPGSPKKGSRRRTYPSPWPSRTSTSWWWTNRPASWFIPAGTLVNALLGKGIAGGEDPTRPGVVHRLDRDTSGLMVLAKGEPAYSRLVEMMSKRQVERLYRAVVVGEGLPETGTIDAPVGRDPDNPTLMAAGVGKPAVTHFEVVADAERHSMLRVRLETGRTHQIRVHLLAIGYPVYADPLYGEPIPGRRLWLHAERLGFEHPVNGEPLELWSDIPDDLRESALGFEGPFAL